MKPRIFLLTIVVISGCSSFQSSEYEFGDITEHALKLQAEYCSNADPQERAFRIALLRTAGVPVPPSGACTDILSLVPSMTLDIDVEQAEKDRDRFIAE